MANSLDLTERFVPLLASKGAAPAILNFRPFEAKEIMSVLSARLAMLQSAYIGEHPEMNENVDPGTGTAVALFTSAAFELLARKIAAATGDLRKALDAARLSIEAIEMDTTRSCSTALNHFTPSTAPRVTPAHVLKVLSNVLGSPQLTKVRALGLQPKLVLLAYLIGHKRATIGLPVLGQGSSGKLPSGSITSLSIEDIECTYTAMLKNDDFAPLESSELVGVIEGLEVEGIVRVGSVSLRSSPVNRPLTPSQNVSLGAKRAAKRQLLFNQKSVSLAMSSDDILKGITTCSPASRSSISAECSPVVVGAINRIWCREEHNADRAKGWEKQAVLNAQVRNEELGGGRGAVGL